MPTDTNGFNVNWSWDFGDGNTSYLQRPSHQYTIASNYMMCLAVKDDDATDTICKTLIISSMVSVDILLLPE